MDDVLSAIRAVHFASSAVLAGVLLFRVLVAEPVLDMDHAAALAPRVHQLLVRIAWGAFVIALLSGAVWLAHVADNIGEEMPQAIGIVLGQTQFGLVTLVRSAAAIALGAALVIVGRDAGVASRRNHWAAAFLAAVFLAALAWTGHSGATPDADGDINVASDAVHLLAAAAWVGGLVPLAALLAQARRYAGEAGSRIAYDATRRFSTLGIVSVGLLLATGLVNAWYLVGSIRALTITEYGRLLLVKVAVFVVMLAFATINRLWLTPRLAQGSSAAPRALCRNSVIEFALGLVVFAIVGVLGTLHPAIHLVPA